MKKGEHHINLACTFCLRSQRDVHKLVAGPNVYICDACVMLCNGVLAGALGDGPPGGFVKADPRLDLSCSFCGKPQRAVRTVVVGPSVHICDECIQLCNDILASKP